MALPRAFPPDGFSFNHQPAVDALNIPAETFLSTRPLVRGAATGALVFSRATGEDRVLLIQRAPHDSMPLRWEIPGGACDLEDETMLHGLARELWEEAGLALKSVVRQVGEEQVFLTRRGLAVAKVTFEVEVEAPRPSSASRPEGKSDQEAFPEVVLDPNEHVRFLWATEEECRQGTVAVIGNNGKKEAVGIDFTTKDQKDAILLGFRLRRET